MNTQQDQDHEQEYCVLINAEEQYSLWPTFKAVPGGWREVGKRGTKEECSSYVDEVWTDMRPKSLREFRAAQTAASVDAEEL